MVVQLGTLRLFDRMAPGHSLAALVTAVELALMHNFIWHLRYTWQDRREEAAWATQLLQFQVSNGLVSLLGNLVLMRLLVHEARQPLLVANTLAILCCSILNFCLGNNWAFTPRVDAIKPRCSGWSSPN